MFYKTKKVRVACADKEMVMAYPVYSGRYTTEQLATDIAYASSLTKGDVQAILSALSKIASQYIENGHPVSLGRLGTLRASIQYKASETVETLSAEKIVRTRILFSPSNELRDILKTMPLERFRPGSCIVGAYAINGDGVATPLEPEP
mgnify:CR=1 FL=1